MRADEIARQFGRTVANGVQIRIPVNTGFSHYEDLTGEPPETHPRNAELGFDPDEPITLVEAWTPQLRWTGQGDNPAAPVFLTIEHVGRYTMREVVSVPAETEIEVR